MKSIVIRQGNCHKMNVIEWKVFKSVIKLNYKLPLCYLVYICVKQNLFNSYQNNLSEMRFWNFIYLVTLNFILLIFCSTGKNVEMVTVIKMLQLLKIVLSKISGVGNSR